MKIRRLKLVGFKSFVDPAELRIEPGLTGIVGPNGCGKSNLLEAIRWVMGEGSPKSLRGGGMEDVIFAGSERRPARSFAEVSMLVEAGAGDEREIEVVRRIERGAGSAYRIDGRDVRAKDVALVFVDAATGAHSPALVSQGRIGAIIAAKPAERRQMLEEAAGIAGLHVRRKDAEAKLGATDANLKRVDAVLAEMEVRSSSLRRQARAAERYRALTEQIRLAEGRLIFARWREAARAAEIARSEAAAADRDVGIAADMQSAAAMAKAEAEQQLDKARIAAQQARDLAREGAHALSALVAERDRTARRLDDLARQKAAIERDRLREGSLASDAADALAMLQEESGQISERSKTMQAGRAPLVARLARAEHAAREAEAAHSEAIAAQAIRQAELRVAAAAVAAANQRFDHVARERDRAARATAALEPLEPLRARAAAAAGARHEAARRSEAAGQRIELGEGARAAASADRDRAGETLAAARAELASLLAEAQALARSTAAAGAGAVTLVRAEPGYERALAAALGEDLTAPVGGEGARAWRAGRDIVGMAPALPLGVRSLADHVEAPAALLPRLAQIIVVDTDSGLSLAVGQRLVTRDGRMRRWDGFEASGGGADTAERLIRVNRLRELERDLPRAQRVVARSESTSDQAATAFSRADAALKADRHALAEAEAELRAATIEEDGARSAASRIEAMLADTAAREEQLAHEHDVAGRALIDAQAQLAAIPPPRDELGAMLAAREATRDALTELRTELGDLDRSLARDAERAAAIEREAAGWQARSGDALARTAELRARLAETEAEAELLRGRPGELADEIVALERRRQADELTVVAADGAERDAAAAQRRTEQALERAAEALAKTREIRAGVIARAESQELRRIELGRVSGERFGCAAADLPARVGFSVGDVGEVGAQSAALDRCTADRERIGPVNLMAERELAETDAERIRLAAERAELGEAVDRLRGSIGSLNREGRARLRAAFEAVDGHFRRLFRTLFDGGEAHLALVDSDDPLEAGLEIMAQPPGKKLTALTLLSGGEQALTAVALIFGLFLTNPAPICVLDEVDAPLDDANVERFCDLLDRMTEETDTRYLIVTHNAVTMSRMARLFGVTMIERGVSRLVSVDLGGANRLLAAE